MKKYTLLFTLLICAFVSAQQETIKISIPSPTQISTELSKLTGSDRIDSKAINLTVTKTEYDAAPDKSIYEGRTVVDATGSPVEVEVADGSITASKLNTEILAAIVLAESSIQDRTPAGFLSPKDYGVITDGSANTSVAFQSFLNGLAPYSKVWIGADETILIDDVKLTTDGILFSGYGVIKHDASAVNNILESDSYGLQVSNTNNVVFDGVRIDGSNIYYAYGRSTVEFDMTTNSQLKNSYLYNWAVTRTYADKFCKITNNYFDEARASLRDSDYCSIDGNFMRLTAATFADRSSAAGITDVNFEHEGCSIDNNYIETTLGIGSFKGNRAGSVSGNTLLIVKPYNSYTIPITIANTTEFKTNNNTIITETLEDNRGSGAYGLELANVKSSVCIGNSISNFARGIMVDGRDLGLGLEDGLTENITVSNNRIQDCGAGVVVFRGVRNLTVTGNTIKLDSNYGTDAILFDFLAGYEGVYPMNINISGNTIHIKNTSGSEMRPIGLGTCSFTNNQIFIEGDSDVAAISFIASAKARIDGNRITSLSTGKIEGVIINNSTSGSLMYTYTNNIATNLYQHIAWEGARGNGYLKISDNTDINCTIASQDWESDFYSEPIQGIKLAYNTGIPTGGSWKKGSRVFSPSTLTSWTCSITGSFGTTSALLTAELGSQEATVTTVTGLYIGSVIRLSSVSYTITEIYKSDLKIKVDRTFTAAFTSQAIPDYPPTFIED